MLGSVRKKRSLGSNPDFSAKAVYNTGGNLGVICGNWPIHFASSTMSSVCCDLINTSINFLAELNLVGGEGGI